MVMAEASARRGVEILCIGTELLLGNILNSNARWLAEELAALGLPHYRQTVVGDNVERLKESVLEAVDRSRILITTGGLGPTPDDLTTETLAAAFDTPLEERPELWLEIQAKLTAGGSISAISNRKQALFPRGAEILPNPSGTAPGADAAVVGRASTGVPPCLIGSNMAAPREPSIAQSVSSVALKQAPPPLRRLGGCLGRREPRSSDSFWLL